MREIDFLVFSSILFYDVRTSIGLLVGLIGPTGEAGSIPGRDSRHDVHLWRCAKHLVGFVRVVGGSCQTTHATLGNNAWSNAWLC
jgi:hypothetical protein